MRSQVMNYQLPLVSDTALPAVEPKFLIVSQALEMPAKNPFPLRWIRDGEPESEEETIHRMLAAIIDSYDTLGANFISDHTRRHLDILEGERFARHATDADAWFAGFRDSGRMVSIVIYVGDPVWGTKAFINKSAEL